MWSFITNNIATITVGAAVAVIFIAAVVKTVRDKRKGSCSCGCQNCAMSEECHKK